MHDMFAHPIRAIARSLRSSYYNLLGASNVTPQAAILPVSSFSILNLPWSVLLMPKIVNLRSRRAPSPNCTSNLTAGEQELPDLRSWVGVLEDQVVSNFVYERRDTLAPACGYWRGKLHWNRSRLHSQSSYDRHEACRHLSRTPRCVETRISRSTCNESNPRFTFSTYVWLQLDLQQCLPYANEQLTATIRAFRSWTRACHCPREPVRGSGAVASWYTSANML